MQPPIAQLAGSAVPFTAQASPTGNVPGSIRLSIQVWLQPRTQGAQRFATAVSTPGSPAFAHYLSPDAYAARFGASPAQARSVAAWLRSAGFTGVHADPQRTYVRATAPVSAVNAAFGVRLRYYRASESASARPYRLRANDRPASVPARLAAAILGITGLDNAAPVMTMARPGQVPAGLPGAAAATSAHQAPSGAAPQVRAQCSRYYGQHILTGLPELFGTTTFPTLICGYSARQLRIAYGVGWTSTGAGQTIALTELGLTRQMFRTLQDYAAANNMPAPSARRYSELSLGQGSRCGDKFNEEEQLDVEASYDMAPGARQIVVGGDSCDNGDFGMQGLFDTVTAVLDGSGTRPLASVTSNSWGTGFESQPPVLTDIAHELLVRGAAEGVGEYFSSGDISGPQAPADDPFAIAVGGTALGIGKTGRRLFETGWSDGISVLANHHWHLHLESGAAGGGQSLLWRQPAYQRGVVPAALSTVAGNRGHGPVRSVPDISAVADPFTGLAVGLLAFGAHGKVTFSETDVGGTSLAAPLVAGMVLDAQQGQARPFGFTDPALYQLARTRAGSRAFTDPLPLTGRSPVRWRAVVCPADTCGLVSLLRLDDQGPLLGTAGQVTLRGYDNMTGIGGPRWRHFIAALRAVEGARSRS